MSMIVYRQDGTFIALPRTAKAPQRSVKFALVCAEPRPLYQQPGICPTCGTTRTETFLGFASPYGFFTGLTAMHCDCYEPEASVFRRAS